MEKIKPLPIEMDKRVLDSDLILSSLNEGLIVLNENSEIIIINDSAKSYLELKNKSYLGKNIEKIVKIPKFLNYVRKLLKQSVPLIDEVKFKKDPDRFFLLSGNILKGPKLGILISLNDITKLKQLEKVRQQFVANVSHELKTPITSIVGFLETIKQNNIPNNKRKTFLKKALKHSNRLNAIIDDLLWLSIIESKEEDKNFHLFPQPLFPILQGAIDDVESSAHKNMNPFRIKCEPQIQINTDSQLFREAIINLLGNAVKYGKSSAEITIKVEENKKFNTTEIQVHNYGYPIPNKYKESIFHRFSRVDKGRSREKGGTGLGLAIVKHIIYVHDGDIILKSSSKAGTTFTISLPQVNSLK